MSLKFIEPPPAAAPAAPAATKGLAMDLDATAAELGRVPVEAAAPGGRQPKREAGRSLTHLATRVFNVPLLIDQKKGDVILSVLGPRLGIDVDCLPVRAFDDDEDDGIDDGEGDDLGYKVVNSIAMIKVHGTLVKRSSWMDSLSGLTSYEDLTKKISSAVANDSVKGILLDIDSGGGEASGMFDLANYIYSLRGVKPVYACADDSAYSAAYGIACGAQQVYVSMTGGVGSIGCYMLHVDQSGYDKQKGIRYTYIYAGDRKVDGNPHEPLDKDAKADLQAQVNYLRDIFVTQVAKARNCTAQQIIDLQAGCVPSYQACPLLADKVGGIQDCLGDMMAKFGGAADEEPLDPKEPPGLNAPGVFIPLFTQSFEYNGGTVTVSGTSGPVTIPISKSVVPGTANVIVFPSQPERANVDVQGLAETFLETVPAGGTLEHLYKNASSGFIDAVQAGNAKLTEPVLALRAYSKVSSTSETGRTIRCRLVPYGELSRDLGGFKEIYQRGCFNNFLNAGDDVRACWNHNPDYILGRRSVNTARFIDEPDGLYMEADAPETQWANDLLTSMRRGDVSGGSAAFFITKPRWEVRSGEKIRVIEEGRLVEGSIASFPLYESATAEIEEQAIAAAGFDIHKAKLKLLAV